MKPVCLHGEKYRHALRRGLVIVALCSLVTRAHADSHSDAILAGVQHLTELARAGDLAGSLAELDRVEHELRPGDPPFVRIQVLKARTIALMRESDGWERASQYLDEAERTANASTPELPLFVLLTRAETANTAQRYAEALSTIRRLQSSPSLKSFPYLRAEAHGVEATTLCYMDQFSAAKAASLAGIEIAAQDTTPEGHRLEARLRANLAFSLVYLHEDKEALLNAEAAIRQLEPHRADRACADSLSSAYLTRAAVGTSSVSDFDEALKILEQTFGQQSASLIPALTTKGHLMIDKGNLDEAESALTRGLDLAKRNQWAPFFHLPIMENLTRLRLRQKRTEEAKQLAATMRDVWRDWVPLVIDAGSETDRLNLLMQSHWVECAIAAGDEPKAVEAIVSTYGIVFDSLLREAALMSRLPHDQRQRYRQNQARLAGLTLSRGSTANTEEVANLRRLIHEMASNPILRLPAPEDIPANGALVVFSPYRNLDGPTTERLAAAVITRTGQRLIKLSASRDAVRSAGDALAAAMRSLDEKASAQQQLDDLREALVTPLKPALGDASELYLCLDGSMNSIPVTIWPNATFLTSPQALLRTPPPARPLASSAIWLLVNTGNQKMSFPPDQPFPYSIANEFKNHTLPPLPGTEREIKDLSESRTEPWNVLQSQTASGEPSENVFVQQIADPPAVIHIAGHAALRDADTESATSASQWWQGVEQPRVLWSSCLFFPDPQPADNVDDLSSDNFLFPAEIAGLDLNGTKLVTLSACETGAGMSPMSEGNYSLARAFHTAGVRDVLSCTEPLPDASVATLMTPFYDRIAKGDDAAKAFREEQLRLIGDDVSKLRQYGFFRLTRAWVKEKK